MRLFVHKHTGHLFLAQKVDAFAAGAGYSGFLLEARALGRDGEKAYVVEGGFRHHGQAMPEDLEELPEEDLVALLPGVSPPSGSGALLGALGGKEKEPAAEAELLDESPADGGEE